MTYTPITDATTLLLNTQNRDAWTPEHDAACAKLGLDPDVYRANDSDNWPPHMRMTCTEATSLHLHVDKAHS